MIDLSGVSTNSFEALEPGTYAVVVDGAEVKETKAKTGEYISVTFKVIEGDNVGRKLFTIFNIKNPNQVAVNIGLKDLKSLLKASGRQEINKLTSVLELIGLKVLAVISKETNDYGEQNKVKFYKPLKNTTNEDINFSF